MINPALELLFELPSIVWRKAKRAVLRGVLALWRAYRDWRMAQLRREIAAIDEEIARRARER